MSSSDKSVCDYGVKMSTVVKRSGCSNFKTMMENRTVEITDS